MNAKVRASDQLENLTIRLTRNQIKGINALVEKYTFLNKRQFTRSEIIRKAINQFLSKKKVGA